MDGEAAGLLALLERLRDLGALGGLGLIVWLLLTGRLVTRGHLNDVMAGKNAEIVKAEAREHEWKLQAMRLADDIVPPLVSDIRGQTRDDLRALRDDPGARS